MRLWTRGSESEYCRPAGANHVGRHVGTSRIFAYTSLLLLLLVAPAFAATRTATTCNNTPSQLHVQAAINQAIDGDTIALPAGSCSWSVNITTSKRLTFQGAGVGATIIMDAMSKAAFPNVPQALIWSVSDTGLHRMTGIEWRGTRNLNPPAAGNIGFETIAIGGRTSQLRIDHNKFVAGDTLAVFVNGWIRGVFDHNTFSIWPGLGSGLYVLGAGWGGTGTNYGDASWNQAPSMGTADNLFVEDNTFTSEVSTSQIGFASDSWMGARVVYRRNTFNSLFLGNHGTDSPGRQRSIRHWEVYENTFNTVSGYSRPSMIGARGGTGRVFDNTVNQVAGASISAVHDFTYYRGLGHTENYQIPATFGLCNGSNTFDGNTTPAGYPCLDQPGRGQGDLLTGDAPNPPPNPPGLRQALEPIYGWNNTINGTVSPITTEAAQSASDPKYMQEGRDYYNVTNRGAQSARPSNCTAGATWWSTDTRTLSQCTGIFWTTLYTPYTYPHPLVSGGTGPTALPPRLPAIPSNLKVQ